MYLGIDKYDVNEVFIEKSFMKLLNEIDRIKDVMGVLKEQEDSSKAMNVNLKSFVTTLKLLKLYSNKVERMLMDISSFAKNQIIDFELMERGIRKVILKWTLIVQ